MADRLDAEARRSRRAQRRREVQRRRRIAVTAVVVIAVAAVIVAVAASSSGGSHAPHPSGAPSHAVVSRPSASSTGLARGTAAGSGHPGTEPVPILMYHVIAPPPAGAPFPGLYVSPSEFTAQMEALKNAGWHAVTLDQVGAYWRSGASLGPGKPIVVSFDNGYHSQYTQALPVLQRLGWVGNENIQLTGLPPSQGGLSSEEVRGLIAAGWELDTQGISHADLITLDAEQLREQVAGARTTLQQRYHVSVNWFCYPSGHYNATVVQAVKEAGYVGSTTVIPGWAHPSDDRYRLHRLRVLGGTSPQSLLELIDGSREDGPAPESYSGS